MKLGQSVVFFVAMAGMTCAGSGRVLAGTPHYDQGLKHEYASEWQLAYDEYRAAADAGETPQARTSPAWRAVNMAADKLERLDEGLRWGEDQNAKRPDVGLQMLMGSLYMNRLKQYEKAKNLYKNAAKLGEQTGDFYGAALAENCVAWILCDEVTDMEYYRHVKSKTPYMREAVAHCETALALCDRIDPSKQDQVFVRRAILLRLSGIYGWSKYNQLYDPKRSDELKAQVAALDGNKPESKPVNDDNDANSLIEQKRLDDAAALLQKDFERHRNAESQLRLLDKLRDAYMKSGQLDKAYATAMREIEVNNQRRGKVTSDAEKTALQLDYWNNVVYEWGLELSIQRHQPRDALQCMEMSKSRAMLDVIAGHDTSAKAGIIDARSRERELLLAKADELRAALANEQKLGKSDQAESLQRSLVLTEDKSERLLANIESMEREVRSTKSFDALGPEEILKTLGSATLVAFYHDIYVVVANSNEVVAYEQRSRGRMREELAKFHEAMKPQTESARSLEVEGKAAPDASSPNYLPHAQALYDILIRPMESHLGTGMVYVVADRLLANLPFQALHDGKKFFVEKHTVAYAPSISILRFCMDKRKPLGGRLVAFGNPNLKDARYQLAYAEEEVKSLAALFPDARVLVGDDASEKAVELIGGDADILHFACHATLNDEDPLLSSLRLSPDEDNDGFLHAAEIFKLNLNAGLVTLSACESLQGRNPMGTEMLGLPRALMYAGAPTVVGSLWKVDDRATSELMTDFYTGLKTKTKAQALSDAEAKMAREGKSPFYWAAFCLYGDYE